MTLAALQAGCRLALANKESLIAGGPGRPGWPGRPPGAEIVPVDSEHCAIHQCLRAVLGEKEMAALPHPPSMPVRRIVLTASGGPFRGRDQRSLAEVTVDDALAHPTWKMGPKITIDSSTLMNKGLEVIEAHELFGVGYDAIEVVVHPQSIVHSMIETTDGATLAQLSLPGHAAARSATPWPIPIGSACRSVRSTGPGSDPLEFEPPDRQSFPCLDLAYQAGRTGGVAPAWLNGANEVAVAAFLEPATFAGSTSRRSLRAALDECDGRVPDTVADVLDADRGGPGPGPRRGEPATDRPAVTDTRPGWRESLEPTPGLASHRQWEETAESHPPNPRLGAAPPGGRRGRGGRVSVSRPAPARPCCWSWP